MTTFTDLRESMNAALEDLYREAQDVRDVLVLPNWGSPKKHGYGRILYGVVKNTFALADRLSAYRAGSALHQTVRLRDAFVSMGADRGAAVVAVQLWRHTLMHTGMPVILRDPSTQARYHWLLHWGDPHLPRSHHMMLMAHPEGYVLNFGALFAVEDLRSVSNDFFDEVSGDPARQSVLVGVHERLTRDQTVSPGPHGIFTV